GQPFMAPNRGTAGKMRASMKSPPLTLNDTQRSCVDAAVRVVCEHRDWALLAINVRTNHGTRDERIQGLEHPCTAG
ncbi:MAG: hypothetical protein ABI305_09860, partial [Tepidiformaceae bacterium]